MGRPEKEGVTSRLRLIRRQLSRLTLGEFARSAGYSASYLSAVELGYLAETADVVRAYERVLGLAPGSMTPGGGGVAKLLGNLTTLQGPKRSKQDSRLQPLIEGRLQAYSADEVLAGRNALLDEAAGLGRAGEIFIVSPRYPDDFNDASGHRTDWKQALSALLHLGWTVTHVLRLDQETARTLRIIEATYDLLAIEGQYFPMYIREEEASDEMHDVLVVAGAGAILTLPSGSGTRPAAYLMREPDEVEVLREHCRGLAERATPLLERIARNDIVGFETVLLRAEELPGDRMVVRDGVWPLTYPEDWYHPDSNWARSSGLEGEELDRLLDVRRQRANVIKRAPPSQRFLAICPKSAMTHFMETGVRQYDARGDFRILPRHEIRHTVENLVANLRTYENFQVALLDPEELRLLQPSEDASIVFWVVKGDSFAWLETWPEDEEGNRIDVHVVMREESVTKALAEHFREVWARVSPRNLDKDYVIWWLEKELDTVERKFALATPS